MCIVQVFMNNDQPYVYVRAADQAQVGKAPTAPLLGLIY